MRIRRGDFELFALDEGRPARPCLLLAHAIATDHTVFDTLVPYLEGDFRILRYDARGHGRSTAPDRPATMADLCDDAMAVLDACDIERAHIVGLSMGGMVAIGLALDRPDRAASAIVCNARASATPAYAAAWSERMALVASEGIAAIVEPSVQRWFAPGFLLDEPQRVAAVRSMVERTSRAGYLGCGAALRELEYGERLTDIRPPVLYLAGEEDQGAPVEIMRDMQRATPGARFVCVPRCGHLSAVERPEIVATAILGFLSELGEGDAEAFREGDER